MGQPLGFRLGSKAALGHGHSRHACFSDSGLRVGTGKEGVTLSNRDAFALSSESDSPVVPQSRNYPYYTRAFPCVPGSNCSSSGPWPWRWAPGCVGCLLEPSRSQVPGLLGAEKPVHSDPLSVQEWGLWVPLDQPGGRSQVRRGHQQPGHPRTAGPLLSSGGLWRRDRTDTLLVRAEQGAECCACSDSPSAHYHQMRLGLE